jgi:hypothetical protein
MSEYHCVVEKKVKPENIEKKVSFNEPEKRVELNQDVQNEIIERNESFLDKLFKVKNLNFIVLATLLYTILNNKEFISTFKNFIPFLFNASNEINMLGNIFIGMLFGIVLIMYISFYMEGP